MREFLHLMGGLAGGGRVRALIGHPVEGFSVEVSRWSSVVGMRSTFRVDSLACLDNSTLCSMR